MVCTHSVTSAALAIAVIFIPSGCFVDSGHEMAAVHLFVGFNLPAGNALEIAEAIGLGIPKPDELGKHLIKFPC